MLGHGHHHLGHAVAAGLPGEAVDQWAVDEPADRRGHHEETQAQPGEMSAGDPALLAELDVAGGRPGEKVDQVAEPDGAQSRAGADYQGHAEQPTPRPPQPAARPPGPPPRHGPGERSRFSGQGHSSAVPARTGSASVPGEGASAPPAGPSGHSLSGIRRRRRRTTPGQRPPPTAGRVGAWPRWRPVTPAAERWPGPPPAGRRG